jgi:hypothetical protein
MTVHKPAALAAAALIWAALAGCDPTARTASSGTDAPPSDRRSREHETCSRSADCAGDLRCFDGVCRRGKLSLLGDLYSALGDRAVTAGQAAQASDAYGQAIAQYEQEKIDPPAQLLCSLGSALISEPSPDKQKLERAARLLHRCLNGAPAGSFLRSRALADLAGLMEVGLDPAVLSRREPADVYLTREGKAPAGGGGAAAGAGAPVAAAPTADALQVAVKLEGRSRSGSYKKFIAYLEKTPDLRKALTPCWKTHFEKTRKDTLAVSLPLQYGHAWDEDETYLSSWIKLTDGATPTEPPVAEAENCARQALGPLFEAEGKKLREESRWQAVATFTVAPGKPGDKPAVESAEKPGEKAAAADKTD